MLRCVLRRSSGAAQHASNHTHTHTHLKRESHAHYNNTGNQVERIFVLLLTPTRKKKTCLRDSHPHTLSEVPKSADNNRAAPANPILTTSP